MTRTFRFAFMPLLCWVLSASAIGDDGVLSGGLPEAWQGRFPLQQAETTGQVKQLLLLNNRWVVLGIYDLPEVGLKLDELAGGRLSKAVRDLAEAEAAGRNNWTAFRAPEKLRREFLAAAREAGGERELDETATFAITSTDDPDYAKPSQPLRATRTLVTLGGNRVPGLHETDYAHYAILEWPAPMKQGCHYTIEVGRRGTVSFVYDENSLVSRAIKVNQAGYLPRNGKKIACLGAWGAEFGPVSFEHADRFEVVNAETGEVALTGPVKLIERNPVFAPRENVGPETAETAKTAGAAPPRPPASMYGEDVYQMDFTGLEEEGIFFLRVPGVGRSWPFVHGANAYGEAFYTATRGFFHQRATTDLKRPQTWWERKKSTMHDKIYEADYVAFPLQDGGPKDLPVFDAVGGTLDRERWTEGVIGGWYDAADWDRNHTHLLVAFDLMQACEAAPEKFTDSQLNLPESGNGVPDLLDEVRWGLECWRRSQDAAGGVSGFIETNSHPGYDDPEHPFAFSRRTRWNSLSYAAAAAQLSRLLRPYDVEGSQLYEESARRAWQFGTDPKNCLGRVALRARAKRGAGLPYRREWEETEEMVAPYRLHAALEMNRLTGEAAYLEGVGQLASMGTAPFQWRFSPRDYSVWMYAGLALDPEKRLPPDLVKKWQDFFIGEADKLVGQLADMPYPQTWPRSKNYWAAWGASAVTNFNRCLFLAHRLTGEPKYLEAIALNTGYMFGVNPLGLSWTTGIGSAYPVAIQHKTSEADAWADPVPGLTVYGITGGPATYKQAREWVWDTPDVRERAVSFLNPANRDVPFYRRWSAHPRLNVGQCEFTIHETMAATAFSCAVLLGPGWQPDDELKNRPPRAESWLFGRWPMP